MTISQEADPEDEDQDFFCIYMVARDRGGFGKNNGKPPSYIYFASKENKDSACAAFGPKCFNCGKKQNFARDCSASFMNVSNIIHPAMGEGSPLDDETPWRRWQNRLEQWYINRNNGTQSRGPRGPRRNN